MGKNQFGVFCDETELDEHGKDDGGDAIPLATIDRIFIRANYDRSAESAFQVDTPDASVEVPGNAPTKTQDKDTSCEGDTHRETGRVSGIARVP